MSLRVNMTDSFDTLKQARLGVRNVNPTPNEKCLRILSVAKTKGTSSLVSIIVKDNIKPNHIDRGPT